MTSVLLLSSHMPINNKSGVPPVVINKSHTHCALAKEWDSSPTMTHLWTDYKTGQVEQVQEPLLYVFCRVRECVCVSGTSQRKHYLSIQKKYYWVEKISMNHFGNLNTSLKNQLIHLNRCIPAHRFHLSICPLPSFIVTLVLHCFSAAQIWAF
jgi:hypothetical protein